MGEGWGSLGLLRGFGLNETRCVVGPGKRRGGGVCVCVNLCDLDRFGISVFGPQTRNFTLGAVLPDWGWFPPNWASF